jgi:DNA invertase Pin-like site-specific DNA recombinase
VKLNEESVSRIKILLSQGVFQKEIALEFGVNRSLISLIKTGGRWSPDAT